MADPRPSAGSLGNGVLIFESYSADEGSVQDNDGTSRGFGFINFENAEEAAVAVEKNNGSILEGKEIWCGRAQKKAEREAELKQK